MTPIAMVSWAARLGVLRLEGTWMAFLAFAATPWILSLMALGELIVDKLPNTPSRKQPAGFGGRLILGILCGVAVALPAGAAVAGGLLGGLGAISGTVVGYEVRSRLAAALGKDLTIALIEDAITIAGAYLVLFGL